MNNVKSTESAVLIEEVCSLMLPVAVLLPQGVEAAFNTGDTNDAISLFTPLLVVMLRGLETLQIPLTLEACELEIGL